MVDSPDSIYLLFVNDLTFGAVDRDLASCEFVWSIVNR